MSLLQWFLIGDTGIVVTPIRGDPPARHVSLRSAHEFPSTSLWQRDRIELIRRSRTWR
jgi:hypothetical protein